jgi:hypothetical protein
MRPHDDDTTPSSLLPPSVANWRPTQPPPTPPPGPPTTTPAPPASAQPPPVPSATPQWRPAPVTPAGGRDDTTRYLCAATQLDSGYADAAIREYLLEPTRPVPPSPGFNAAAVLNEAVAARSRRLVRDWLVIALSVGLCFTAPPVWLLCWAVPLVALAAAAPASRRLRAHGWAYQALQVFLVLVGVGLVAPYASRAIESARLENAGLDANGFLVVPPDHSTRHALAIVLVIALAVVVLVDRYAVWNTLTGRLRERGGDYDTGIRGIHQVAHASHNAQVDRVRRAADSASGAGTTPVVVYRGFSPFVGAGRERSPWSIATALTPLPPPVPGLTTAAATTGAPARTGSLTSTILYERVREEMSTLIRATPLTPGRRLRQLSLTGLVVASAEELVDHLGEPAVDHYLAGPDQPPKRWVSATETARLRAEPEEWARYYQCYRVETWDRDLVISVFVHLAVDDSTLYVEWTPCVLQPIERRFRAIDGLSRNSPVPLGQALVRLAQVPISLPGRLVHSLRWLRPLPADTDDVARTMRVNPDRYGNEYTLRELAASADVHHYLQLADLDRYRKILENRFVLVVSGILREFGYSAAEFDLLARSAGAQNLFIGNTINGPLVTGGTIGTVTGGGTISAAVPAANAT